MAARVVLAILAMNICIDRVSAEKVPSQFIGLWKGSAKSGPRSWDVFTSIVEGGPRGSTIGYLSFMSSLHRCLHEIQVAPVEGGEEEGNESETTDRFRAVSKGFAKGWGSCNLGEFNFEPVSGTDNKMIMDVVLLRENGEVKETFTVIQVRVDDAEMAKQADEEEVGAAESPASRLREKIKCRQEGD